MAVIALAGRVELISGSLVSMMQRTQMDRRSRIHETCSSCEQPPPSSLRARIGDEHGTVRPVKHEHAAGRDRRGAALGNCGAEVAQLPGAAAGDHRYATAVDLG